MVADTWGGSCKGSKDEWAGRGRRGLGGMKSFLQEGV